MKSTSIFCRPSILKQYQCFEPARHKVVVGHKDMSVLLTVYAHASMWDRKLLKGDKYMKQEAVLNWYWMLPQNFS